MQMYIYTKHMTLTKRLTASFVALLLLAAIIFIFNSTPLTLIVDESESQIASTVGPLGQKLPIHFVLILSVSGFVLLLKAFWTKLTPLALQKNNQRIIQSRIARGPPFLSTYPIFIL